MYVTQGLQHVKSLLNHIWRKTTTGKLLVVSMGYLRLKIGINGPLLMNDYDIYGHLAEESWINHTWKFLTEVGLQIRDEVMDFELVRGNDRPLGEIFAKAFIRNTITKSE